LPIDYPAVRHDGFVGLSAAEAIASIVEIQGRAIWSDGPL
jgi:hypothetical protein